MYLNGKYSEIEPKSLKKWISKRKRFLNKLRMDPYGWPEGEHIEEEDLQQELRLNGENKGKV